ncbi:hypothetical protein KKG24_04820, partial [Patescibacteria group bacterium]|nr:hypothetical protein [Patescibacteria group bacterium]
PDGTAGLEIATPVHTSVGEMAQRTGEAFLQFLEVGVTPLLSGSASHESMGTHIHLGVPDRRLTYSEIDTISRHIKSVYPFLVALHVNDKRFHEDGIVRSRRGFTSRYCRDLKRGENYTTDHFGEISRSYHGTVELRKFDSNVPQVTLAVSTIARVIALGALNGVPHKTTREIVGRTYSHQMKKALTSGVIELKVEKYIDYIFENYSDQWATAISDDLPECVWQIISLALDGKVISDFRDNNPEFFKDMLTDITKLPSDIPEYIPKTRPNLSARTIAVKELVENNIPRKTILTRLERFIANPTARLDLYYITQIMEIPTIAEKRKYIENAHHVSWSKIKKSEYLKIFCETPTVIDSRFIRINELTSAEIEAVIRLGFNFETMRTANERYYFRVVNNVIKAIFSVSIRDRRSYPIHGATTPEDSIAIQNVFTTMGITGVVV